MRSNDISTFCIVFIFSLLSCLAFCLYIIPAAISADWEYYSLDSDRNMVYFDKASMLCDEDVVQVWQRKVFGSGNLHRIRQALGDKYAKLSEQYTFYRINCPSKTIQELVVVYYDTKGRFIDNRLYEFIRDWKKITPRTDMDRLHGICCEEVKKSK